MAPVTIHGNTIEPDAAADGTPSRFTSRDAENTNYIYVQGEHLLNNDEKLQLQSHLAEILAFEGDNTYLCRYPPKDLTPLRQLPFVRHANAYHKLFKASASLKELLQNQDRATVTIALHDGARSPSDVEAVLRDIDGVENDTMAAHSDHITVDITASGLQRLEALDDIKMIEYKPQTGIMNDQARNLVKANQLSSSKLPGSSLLDGSKVLVTVADTGFDKGSADDKHPAFKNCEVQLLAIGRDSGTSPKPNQLNDFNGHGTHVAGSVLGNWTSTDLAGATATAGSSPASIPVQGTATGASLLLQSLLTSSGGLKTTDISRTLYQVAYNAPYNSRIHTNSWGITWNWASDPSQRFGPYTYDQGSCADTDSFINRNEDFVILFAAGNDQGKPSDATDTFRPPAQIGGYAAAKNIITVGASKSSREYLNNRLSLSADSSALASFSSQGPTMERRKKPDVVSPGTNILSTKSRDALDSKIWKYSPAVSDPLWGCISGTSMATPIAAGCVALIQQALREAKASSLSWKMTRTVSPTAALIKALVIHYASDMKVDKINTSPSSPDFGYGRINADAVLTAIAQRKAMSYEENYQGFEDSTPPLAMNNKMSMTVAKQPGKTSTTLKVTMVYSDLGNINIQNSLLLSVQGIDADTRPLVKNNVQQLVSTNISGNKASISVEATNIAPVNGTQTFALVWSWV